MDLFGGAPPATKSKFGGALQANNNEIAGHGPPLGHGPTPLWIILLIIYSKMLLSA